VGFFSGGRCVTHQGAPLLDQRIRVCFNGVLMNLHLLLVAVFSAPHRGQLRDDDQNRDERFVPDLE
jgi:hypothetical protein